MKVAEPFDVPKGTHVTMVTLAEGAQVRLFGTHEEIAKVVNKAARKGDALVPVRAVVLGMGDYKAYTLYLAVADVQMLWPDMPYEDTDIPEVTKHVAEALKAQNEIPQAPAGSAFPTLKPQGPASRIPSAGSQADGFDASSGTVDLSKYRKKEPKK